MGNKAKEYLHLFAEGGPSFFAFLLSVFIYVSVFNLSLSTLFNNTKFWFCISNTLIFIIAADCGALSPPKQTLPDFHGGDPRRNNAAKTINIPKQENEAVIVRERSESQEDKLQIIIREPAYNSDKPSEDIPQKKSCEKTTKFPSKTYKRSKSEKAKRVVELEKESKITMRRSKTMIQHVATKDEEENEFAEMTDEELNRRIEEFIERFNRQIRLQGGIDYSKKKALLSV